MATCSSTGTKPRNLTATDSGKALGGQHRPAKPKLSSTFSPSAVSSSIASSSFLDELGTSVSANAGPSPKLKRTRPGRKKKSAAAKSRRPSASDGKAYVEDEEVNKELGDTEESFLRLSDCNSKRPSRLLLHPNYPGSEHPIGYIRRKSRASRSDGNSSSNMVKKHSIVIMEEAPTTSSEDSLGGSSSPSESDLGSTESLQSRLTSTTADDSCASGSDESVFESSRPRGSPRTSIDFDQLCPVFDYDQLRLNQKKDRRSSLAPQTLAPTGYVVSRRFSELSPYGHNLGKETSDDLFLIPGNALGKKRKRSRRRVSTQPQINLEDSLLQVL